MLHELMVEQAGCEHPAYQLQNGPYHDLVWCSGCREVFKNRPNPGFETNRHPRVAVEYPIEDGMYEKGTLVEIDELIAPLIDKLWKLGIGTENCCQGDSDEWAMISFFDSADAMRFLDCLRLERSTDPESLDRRAAIPPCESQNRWQWTAMPFGFPGDNGEHIFQMWASVRFPPEDLDKIIERFEGAPLSE